MGHGSWVGVSRSPDMLDREGKPALRTQNSKPKTQDPRPSHHHNNPASRNDTHPDRPTTMWSRRRMPTDSDAAASRLVNSRSSREGAGSPEGWLWYRITPAAFSRSARFKISRGSTT